MTIKAKPIWELDDYQGSMPNNQDIMAIIDVDGDVNSMDEIPQEELDPHKFCTRKISVGEIKKQMNYMSGKAASLVFRTLFESITGFKSNPDEYVVSDPKEGEPAIPTDLAVMLNNALNYLADPKNKILNLDNVYRKIINNIAAGEDPISGITPQKDLLYIEEGGFFSAMRDAMAKGMVTLDSEALRWILLLNDFLFVNLRYRTTSIDQNTGIITVSNRYFYNYGASADDVPDGQVGSMDLTNADVYDCTTPPVSSDTPESSVLSETAAATRSAEAVTTPALVTGWTKNIVGTEGFIPVIDGNSSRKINKIKWNGLVGTFDLWQSGWDSDNPRLPFWPSRSYLVEDYNKAQGTLFTSLMARPFRSTVNKTHVTLSGIDLKTLSYNNLWPADIKFCFGPDVTVTGADMAVLSFSAKWVGEIGHQHLEAAGWERASVLPTDGTTNWKEAFKLNLYSPIANDNTLYKYTKTDGTAVTIKWVREDDYSTLGEGILQHQGFTCSETKYFWGSAEKTEDAWTFNFRRDAETSASVTAYVTLPEAAQITLLDGYRSVAVYRKGETTDDLRCVVWDARESVQTAWETEGYQPVMAAEGSSEMAKFDYYSIEITAGSTSATATYRTEASEAPVQSAETKYIYTDSTTSTDPYNVIELQETAVAFVNPTVFDQAYDAITWTGWDLLPVGKAYDLSWTCLDLEAGSYVATISFDQEVDLYVVRAGEETTDDPNVLQADRDGMLIRNAGDPLIIKPYIWKVGASVTSRALDQTYFADNLGDMTVWEFVNWVLGGFIGWIKKLLMA